MANIGYATLTVIPSARGFRRKLENEVEDDTRAVGRSSGKAFGEGFNQSVVPAVTAAGSTMSRFGRVAATAMGRVSVSMSTLGTTAAVALPAVAFAAVAVIGALTSLAAAATVTAASIGAAFAGIGIGAALFAQTTRGEAALTRFKAAAARILSDAAEPLFRSFETALGSIEDLLGRLSDEFAAVFSTLAGVVDRFVSRAIPAVERLAPAFAAVTTAASRFFDGLSSTFGLIADKLGPALAELAPRLRTVASMLGRQLGQALARILPALTRLANEALPVLPVALKLVTIAIRGLIAIGNLWLDSVRALAVALLALYIKALQTAKGLLQLANVLPGVNTQTQIAALRTQILSAKQLQTTTTSRLLHGATLATGRAMSMQARQTNRARRALVNYQETVLNGLSGLIAYKRQLDATSRELREGAASFNLNSKEGRENAQVVLDQIAAAREQIATYRQQGRTTEFVAGKTRQFSRELARAASEAGFTDQQVINLITSLDAVPRSVRTRIRSNADSAREAVQALIGSINNVDTYTRVTFEAQYLGFKDVGGTVTGPQYQHGGYVFGPGTATSDSISARLSAGEYVVNAAAVDRYGRDLFDKLNARKLAGGGLVGSAAGAGSSPGPATAALIGSYTQNFYGDTSASDVLDETMFRLRLARRGGAP